VGGFEEEGESKHTKYDTRTGLNQAVKKKEQKRKTEKKNI